MFEVNQFIAKAHVLLADQCGVAHAAKARALAKNSTQE
jgi:hypothetical protein